MMTHIDRRRLLAWMAAGGATATALPSWAAVSATASGAAATPPSSGPASGPPASPYMGGPVKLVTDDRGAIANAAYVAHGASLVHKLHRVTDRIYCQMGSSLANSTLVLGSQGMVVIDTGDCIQQSAAQLADFRTVTDRPLSALIYSHSHYALGARTYVPPERDGQVPIYAHKDLLQVLSRTIGDLNPFLTRRVAIQFGMFLPTTGPDSMPNFGLGKVFYELDKYTPTAGFVRPNHFLDDGQKETIDGVAFQFWHSPADTEDTLLIWMPEDRVVVNNIAWPTMFNIYTLRGETFRNPTRLLPGLDKILELKPEHLVGVHGAPISGESEVRTAVTEYRDCIQFTYDRTVCGINRGLSPDELVRFVKLPDALANGRLTGQFYGELPFYVRQIYAGLVGWFGTDTVELHPVTEAESARRWASLVGGTSRLESEARAALDRHEYSWAAELATAALRADPGSSRAKSLKAEALRAMGQVTTAANTRSWYLTQARELEGQVDTSKPPVKFANATTVKQLPAATYVNALRFRLDPDLSKAQSRSLLLTIGTQAFGLTLRNGVVLVAPNPDAAANYDARVAVSVDQWAALVARDTTATRVVADGAVVSGDNELTQAVLNAWS